MQPIKTSLQTLFKQAYEATLAFTANLGEEERRTTLWEDTEFQVLVAPIVG